MENKTLTINPQTVFVLSSIRRVTSRRIFRFRVRRSSAHILCLVESGEGTLILDDDVQDIRTHSLYYIPEGSHLEAALHSQESSFLVIEMEALAIGVGDKIGKGTEWLTPGRLPLQSTHFFLTSMTQLYKRYHGQALDYRSHLELQHMLFKLMDIVVAGQDKVETPSIQQSIQYIQRNLYHKLTLRELAQVAGLTPTAFCRSFKKQTGFSPMDYANKLRIEDAKLHLNNNQSVKEVAASLGFSNEYYFSRLFKKSVGVPPVVYSGRHHLRVAIASFLNFADNLNSLGVEPVFQETLFPFGLMSLDLDNALCRLQESKPNLIIVDFFHTHLIGKLKAIAPTVILDYNEDWRVLHRRLSELVGREKEATRTFIQLDFIASRAKKQLENSSKKRDATIMYVEQDKLRIQGAVQHPLSQLLYKELGLFPGKAVPLMQRRIDFDSEHLPILKEDDHYFVHLWGEETTPFQKDCHGNLISSKKTTQIITDWLSLSWTPTGRKQIIDNLIQSIE